MSESDPTGLAGGTSCSWNADGTASCSSSVSPSPPPAAPPQAAPQASPPTSSRMPQSQGIHYDPEVGSDASATARSAGDYAAHAPSNPRSVLSGVGQRAYSSARSAAVGAYGAAASIASRAGSIAESIAVTLEEDSDVRAALDLLGAEVPAEGILAKEAVAEYEVGTFDALKAKSTVGDGLDIHHVVQANPAQQLIPGYSRATAPSIAVPAQLHRAIPRVTGQFPGSARDLLAKGIRDLRSQTNAPNSALQKLIQLNQQTYPGAFGK